MSVPEPGLPSPRSIDSGCAENRADTSQRGGERRPPKGSLVAVLVGVVVLLLLFVFGLVLIPKFQAAHPPTPLQRSDADLVGFDDLYLDMTLVTPGFLESRKLERHLGGRDPESVLPIMVGLNTHTGTIEHMHHLPNRLSLVGPGGHRYPSIGEPIVLSQHHNAYVVLFPARDQQGRPFLELEEGSLVVEAQEIGLRPLRSFAWQLPIPDIDATLESAGWATRLALVVALIAALLVVLSPCALELSLYYSAIISCTVAAGESAALSSGAAASSASGLDPALDIARRKVIANLLAFVAGFTLLYAASGATVGLIGQGVRQPLGEYGEWFQIGGGLLILYFAMRVAGVDRWIGALLARLRGAGAASRELATSTTRTRPRLVPPAASHGSGDDHSEPGRWSRVLGAPRRGLAALRKRGQLRARSGHGMRARDSFLVGMGLSSACLTCMGGAVLYPLLVYAGVTSWYSGLITLTLYSLGIAVPMLLIALGFVRIRVTLTKKLGFHQALRAVSAVMLTAIGLMILFGYERIITDTVFGLLARVSDLTV